MQGHKNVRRCNFINYAIRRSQLHNKHLQQSGHTSYTTQYRPRERRRRNMLKKKKKKKKLVEKQKEEEEEEVLKKRKKKKKPCWLRRGRSWLQRIPFQFSNHLRTQPERGHITQEYSPKCKQFLPRSVLAAFGLVHT